MLSFKIRTTRFVSSSFFVCWFIGTVVCQFEPKITDNDGKPLMFPNERTTLNDCHLRFHQLLPIAEVKPAFGLPVPLKEFAHMGAIGWTQRNGNILWQCGGTLIWDNFVLTAAHCAVDSNNQAPDVVRFGDIDLFSADDDQYAQQLKIAGLIRHPMHKFSGHYHDIALVKLEKNVRLHDTVVPACLWLDEEIRFRNLEATGWGKTGFAQEQTPVLLKVILKPITNEQCGQTYNNVTTRKLRTGLEVQHICAVDDRMDTCEGDSGGPLQIKLMHNSKVTPFIVGITSFGTACGTSTPGVYTRVSVYHDWIVSTMRKNGALVDENTYNATFCALRYVQYREYEDAVITEKTVEFTSYNSETARIKLGKDQNQLAEIGWDSEAPENCFGVIVDEDTVLTIADCTNYKGKAPTFVAYLKGKTTSISKIHVPSGYIEGKSYENIAILKMAEHLDLPITFTPSCIWHERELPFSILQVVGYGREDINEFAYLDESIALNPNETFLTIQSRIFNESSCVLPDSYSRSLPRGLAKDHLCIGNDVFLVPESCRLMIGAPVSEDVYINDRKYHTTFALSQQGRDCAFGEYMLATLSSEHVDWMKSVLLPNYQDTSSSWNFLDLEIQEGSSCKMHTGEQGRCVSLEQCSVEWFKLIAAGQATFCSNTKVACCPVTKISTRMNRRILPEILECPEVVKQLAVQSAPGSMVDVGWVDDDTVEFRCSGAIITKLTIVTSASCLGDDSPSIVRLRTNVTRNFGIKGILKHPNYNSTEHLNDIALIRLRKPLSWNVEVFPTCLWTNTTHTPLVMGLVFEDEEEQPAFDYVAPMYNSDCQRTHPQKIHDSQICARSYLRSSTCISAADQLRMDDPTTNVSYLIGLIVDAPDCVDWRYAVFTRISSFLDWISANAVYYNFNKQMMMTKFVIPFFLACYFIGNAVCQFCPKTKDDHGNLLMFPNERTSLNDCHLRFHQLFRGADVAPAFGMPVPLKEFAHIGAVGWTQPTGDILWQCGGTLIWDNFVLTAAHCAVDERNQAPDVVRLGDIDLYSAHDDQYAQQLKVVDIIRHPMHKFSSHYHDIALLKLEKNVTLHDTVAPACLWLDEELRFRKLEAAGWGNTGFAQEKTPILLKVALKPISNEQCSQFYTNETTRKLRNGLQEQHLCAVDDKMDTCEGDSGGPLQIKLMHNSKVTPFIVGITSFGSACGTAAPGVYTKVSVYHDWIVSTMRKNGALVDENTCNATFCALRYVQYREYEDAVITEKTVEFTSYNSELARVQVETDSPNQLAEIGWGSERPEKCFGVIIDENTVLTIADCSRFKGEAPIHITYMNGRKANISEIHVPTGYVEGNSYDNIAILKLAEHLDLPRLFTPSCIWHGKKFTQSILNVLGYGREDINTFANDYAPIALNPNETLLNIQSRIYSQSNCVLPNSYSRSIPRGLAKDHLCIGNDVFLVPESCRLMIGAPVSEDVYINDRKYHTTLALSQQGRDCAFGEYMLATLPSMHVEWMKSILLPNYQDTSGVLSFTDPDTHEGSRCEDYAGVAGRCVTLNKCSVEWPEFLSAGHVKFCSSSKLICCPLNKISAQMYNGIHTNIFECPKFVKQLGVSNSVGSMVDIGWIAGGEIEFRCVGAIITELVIITSASCLDGSFPRFVRLMANVRRRNYEIQGILKHPNYDSIENINDIALIQLRQPLYLNAYVFPMCLWTNTTHTPLVMMVYKDDEDGTTMDYVAPMYNSDCQRKHPRTIHRSQICGRSYLSNSTCNSLADQLLLEDVENRVSYLVGLIVNAPDCVNWRYAVYTRITSFLDWISSNAFGR
ncbi:uncharacterized protein LOC131429172 [Malaya genurostris]|uniref:uncharacterized protein LOC131429172 n=1 Tax=Malaya genurostris TaxID=325434 RepID=UPI0026F3D5D9|nr:uncharacterized protein LOC131429172 [Malaya genurostris]